MELQILDGSFTVCKPSSASGIDLSKPFCFAARTDEELSLVCRTQDVPAQTDAREDGWRGIRICGVLDFSLIGILSKLSAVLAREGIGIFAVSTYNTDYIFLKAAQLAQACGALQTAGYPIAGEVQP